jgi:guanine nucleotide-binding protein subunit alpha
MTRQELGHNERFPQEYRTSIRSLWNDSGVNDAVTKCNEYAIHDNLA